MAFYPKVPEVLWLPQSPHQILAPLIGKRAFSSVANGPFGRYTYPAEIIISEFSTSIDCDDRNYSARVVSAKLLARQQLAHAETRNLGC